VSNDLLDEGYACLRRGDPEAALRRFRQAADAQPERPQTHFAMAMAYLDLGYGEKVMQALDAALNVNPVYVSARAFRGIELLKRYDVDGAQEELERALHDAPTNLLAHLKYAEYYYRLGFYQKAVAMLEKGLKAPHGADEHLVAMARDLLSQSRQKCKGTILREPPDPRQLLRFFVRFRSMLAKRAQTTREVS
jgi:tetratricopeptide (TPR) repeat protein